MLVVDMILYFVLTIYLENVIQGEYGTAKPLLYFLSPSYWFDRIDSNRSKSEYSLNLTKVNESEFEMEEEVCCEEMPPEFEKKIGLRYIYKKRI